MKDLIKKVDKLGDVVERLQSLQSGSGGGGGVTTATLPLAITGSNIAIAATTTNDGGAIVKQASSPGTQQTGNINISGKLTAGSANLSGNITAGSVSTSSLTSSTISTTSSITGNTFIQAGTTIQAINGPYYLGSVPILDSGGTFPTSSLVDGERYWHTTYRSWFTYNLTDTRWRQESPGVFDGSFPTVSSGDNTVAPNIEIKRKDRRNLVFYWDGARWLSPNIWLPLTSRGAVMPFAQGTTFFDVRLGGEKTGTGVLITDLQAEARFISVAQSAANYYTLSLVVSNGTVAGNVPLSGTTTSQAFGTGHTDFTPTVVVSPAPTFDTTYFLVEATMTPTGNPGTFIFFSTLGYQLIG